MKVAQERISLPCRFFGVLSRRRTYLNGLYLLSAFPLGIAYGVFLMTGWFLGYGLVSAGWQSIVLVSDPYAGMKILPVLFAGFCAWLLAIATCWLPASIERLLAGRLLGVAFPASPPPSAHGEGMWSRAWTYLSDPVTWKSLVFVALKFPAGIAMFTVITGLISASAALLFAPLAHLMGFRSFIIGPWRIDTWGETFLAVALGIFFLPFSLHLLNGIASASGWFARLMLGHSGADRLPAKPAPHANRMGKELAP